MARFRNVVTNNVLNTTNEDTIALMIKSDQYVRLPDKPVATPAGKKKATKGK